MMAWVSPGDMVRAYWAPATREHLVGTGEVLEVVWCREDLALVVLDLGGPTRRLVTPECMMMSMARVLAEGDDEDFAIEKME